MPKLKEKAPRVANGEHNPRHYIMIPVGTGNKYCRNCSFLRSSVTNGAQGCFIFGHGGAGNPGYKELKIHKYYGAERCQPCLDAERSIYELKKSAAADGENTAMIREGLPSMRSSLLNART